MYLTTSHPNSNHSIVLVLIVSPQVWTGLRKSLYLRSRILKSCPQVFQCNCQATSGWIKLCLVFIFFWSADPSNMINPNNGMLWTQNKHVEDCPSPDIPACAWSIMHAHISLLWKLTCRSGAWCKRVWRGSSTCRQETIEMSFNVIWKSNKQAFKCQPLTKDALSSWSLCYRIFDA